MPTNLTTLRETLRETLDDLAAVAVAHQHDRNYWTLYVYSDGDTAWAEETDSSWGRIAADNDSTGSAQYQAWLLRNLGTGSCACNCDHCLAGGGMDDYPDIAEAESEMVRRMEEALDALPQGYFDDEDNEAEG